MIPLLFSKAKYCPSHSSAVQCALLNGRERVTLPARNAGNPEFVHGSGVIRLSFSEDDRCDFCLTIDLAAAFQLGMET